MTCSLASPSITREVEDNVSTRDASGRETRVKTSSEGVVKIQRGTTLVVEGSASGRPPPSVRFLKDGAVVSAGGRYSLGRTPDGGLRLTVSDVAPGDSGEYTFVAQNAGGVTSSSQQIAVSGNQVAVLLVALC